jgi:WD40 repeat protein
MPVENGGRLVEADTGNTHELFHEGDQGPPGHYHYLHDWQQQWPECVFSPDSKLLFVTGLVDPGHEPLLGNVLPSRFNPFRSSSSESVCRVWKLESGEEVMAFPGCTDARFSPDGRVLATIHKGGMISLWDFPFRKPLHRVLGLSVLIWLGIVLPTWLLYKGFRTKGRFPLGGVSGTRGGTPKQEEGRP